MSKMLRMLLYKWQGDFYQKLALRDDFELSGTLSIYKEHGSVGKKLQQKPPQQQQQQQQ